MLVWPVIEREMLTVVRRPWAWRGRILPAFLAVMMLAYWVLYEDANKEAELGRGVFVMLSLGMFVLAGLGGLMTTADCLSRERREGTLGLLFLTDLQPGDVLMGKGVAASFRILFGILAVVPVLTVTLLAGGVSIRDVEIVTLGALDTLFLSLAAGLFASSIYEHGSKALSVAVVVMLFLVGGLPLLGSSFETYGMAPVGYPTWVNLASPGALCFLALESIGSAALDPQYPWCLLGVHIVGWMLVLFAKWRVVRSLRIRSASSENQWWINPLAGTREYRDRIRTRLLETNAYLWRCALPVRKPIAVWLVIGTPWVVYFCACLGRPSYFRNELGFGSLFALSALLVKVWVAIEAPHALCTDRETGALELLAVTPATTGQLVVAQCAALIRQFGAPVLLLCFTAALTLCLHTGPSYLLPWKPLLFVGGVVFLGDLATLSFVSMAGASLAMSEIKIVSISLLLVTAVPWILFVLYLKVGDFVMMGLGWVDSSSDWGQSIFIQGGWMLISLVCDALILVWSIQRLRFPFSAWGLETRGRFRGRPWTKAWMSREGGTT